MARLLVAWVITVMLVGSAFTDDKMAGEKRSAGSISQDELLKRIGSDDAPLIIDVRRSDEFNKGHVPGAINIAHNQLANRLDEIRSLTHGDIVLYCESGRRAGIAFEVLEQAGFSKLFHLQGDMAAWRNNNRPVQ